MVRMRRPSRLTLQLIGLAIALTGFVLLFTKIFHAVEETKLISNAERDGAPQRRVRQDPPWDTKAFVFPLCLIFVGSFLVTMNRPPPRLPF